MAYRTVNPATGETVATFDAHSDADIDAALDQAQKAFATWRRRSVAERVGTVRKVAALMRERSEDLARLGTLEMGKLIGESRGEVALSADILDYYADNAERLLAPVEIAQKDGTATVVSDPIGIIFAIEPWNFPYYQVVRVAGPNLVTGNVVLLKHAPGIPQCADALQKLFLDAGAEPGLFTNLRLDNDQSSRVIADPRVQGVALTGSNRAGEAVAAEAGKATKKTTLELGGSDPFIVLEDANLEMAIKWATWSRLLNCGQGCVDAKRFIVVAPLYDGFVDGVKAAIAERVIGDPMEERTQTGPLSSEGQHKLLLDQIQRALDGGATLAMGGKPIDRPGFFIEPAIITDITPDNPAYREEFFGPVFLMVKARDRVDAIRLANDTEFGLASAILSEDVEGARQLAREIDAGMVFINHAAWTAPELPFGGVKQSGYGRELGDLGAQEFVNKKLIRVQDATSEVL